VLTLLLPAAGLAATVALVRAGRRQTAVDRVVRLRGGRARQLPGPLRRPLVAALDRAALDLEPEVAVQVWLLAVLAVGALGLALAPALGALGGLVVLAGGPVGLRLARHRRARALAAGLPDLLEAVASELRGGGTVVGALRAMARRPGSAPSEGPLRADVTRLANRLDLGAAPIDALATWSRERRLDGVRTVAGALALATEVGGPAADALDDLAASLRDRDAVVAEAHALSAQARLSALVVGAAPLGYLGFAAVTDPRAVGTLTGTAVGRACLVAGLTLDALAGWWMRSILGAGEP